MGTLPRWLTGMDGDRPILASRAAALLRAVATALLCRVINVSAIAWIDAHVFQGLALRADIAVLLGQVSELVDAIEIARPIGIFFHPDVRSDAAVIQPLQQFAVAVGGIRGQRLRQVAVTFAITFDHVP